jgi:ABC-2 type transport system ATP-binding protein
MNSQPAADAASVVVRTRGLTKRYGAVVALDDLDVTLSDGVTGLVGANGAGKSTLIKILLGLLQPTSGSARVLGHDPLHDGAEIRRAVGYMPEHDCLPPDVSASDFIVHLAQMSGLPRTAARERTGMKQRAKLAQALVHDPRLVLLDEPTNGLDPAARDDMLSLVRRIGHDFGIAVLVTSHLLGELERVSDHVVVLDGGRLLRASATTDFMVDTGTLLVEVLGEHDAQARMVAALLAAGIGSSPRGHLLAIVPPPGSGDRIHDLIRDAACDAGVGIVRLQADHHRIEDVFSYPEREPLGGADVAVS